MEFLFEILFEIIVEGCLRGTVSRRLPLWLRVLCAVVSLGIFGGLVALLVVCGVLHNAPILIVLGVALGIFLGVFGVKVWKSKR